MTANILIHDGKVRIVNNNMAYAGHKIPEVISIQDFKNLIYKLQDHALDYCRYCAFDMKAHSFNYFVQDFDEKSLQTQWTYDLTNFCELIYTPDSSPLQTIGATICLKIKRQPHDEVFFLKHQLSSLENY